MSFCRAPWIHRQTARPCPMLISRNGFSLKTSSIWFSPSPPNGPLRSRAQLFRLETTMYERVATLLVDALYLYCIAGSFFAIAFVTSGVKRIDSQATDSGIGFHVLIFP